MIILTNGYPNWLSIHLNSIVCLPQTRAIWSKKFTEEKKNPSYSMQWPVHSNDRTRALDVMFDKEVFLALISAEHHTINHKLDLCFFVVPFVSSSEKFHISSIWKIVYLIVYYVHKYIVISWYGDAHWSRSHSYQSYYSLLFVQIMIWHTVHRSSFVVYRPSNHNVWGLKRTIKNGRSEVIF